MEKTNLAHASRRDFLKATASGLVIAFFVPESLRAAGADVKAVSANLDFTSSALPNAFIKIAPDNSITLTMNKLEMGQGIFTSLAQLIAEELECNWQDVRCEAAPVNPVYNNTAMPMQMTGGSNALITSWEQHRRIGAMAREMLISAAAKKWNVERSTCHAENGKIHHETKSLPYGELAELAALEKPPQDIKLKTKNFKVIGKSIPRVDSVAKTTGKAIFGLDVKIPGMGYAVISRPPFGAKFKTMDETSARAVHGVTDVVRFGDSVAVIATNTYAAKKGRESLNVTWDLTGSGHITSTEIMANYKKLAEKPDIAVRNDGDVVKAHVEATHFIEAEFEFPYLAHAAMEPMNCTIDYDGKKVHVWAGHQMPTGDMMALSKILDLSPDKIEVTTVFAGGSFGRRASKVNDYVVEAALLAKQYKKPVKIVWTREDDMKGGSYRPMYYHKAKIGIKNGHISGWDHVIVGQSIMAGSPFEAFMVKNRIDPTTVEGVSDSHYAVSDFRVDLHSPNVEVTTLWWRSVGNTHTAYVMETLIDEIAVATKKDPLALRKELLAKSPRHMAVLNLLEKKSGWGKTKLPKGHAYGLAIHESFNSVVGHVVEVAMNGNDIAVKKIISAVHCGTVVNPQGAKTQVEGAIAYGLSACLKGEITLDKGQVVQNNFHDYQVLRMNEMPKIEVHFVETNEPPTGLGEPGLPPVAPAIANAVFRLNGKRLRKLPFKNELSQS